jgi:hypothetical protein
MTNQINANVPNFNVPSLSQMATVAILESSENVNKSKTVTEVFYSCISYTKTVVIPHNQANHALFNQWNSIKHEFAPEMSYYDVEKEEAEVSTVSQPEWRVESCGTVAKTIKRIESKVLQTKPANVDPYQFLQANVTTLFSELKKVLPVPLTDLAMVQVWEDEALEKIYGHLVANHNFPPLNTAAEMKAFLNDPANSPLMLSVRQIYMSNSDLKAIPPEILKFSNVYNLNLNNNKICFIPEWLGQLKKLRRLTLCANQIAVIPESFGDCQKLQYLRLDMNQITEIPNCIGNLKELDELHLTFNSIRLIPDSLKKLTKLHDILLSHNQIEEIPTWLGERPALSGIYLSNNKIHYIPDSLNQRHLMTVALESNPIIFIPDWAKNSWVVKHDGLFQIRLNQIYAYIESISG